MLDPGGLQRSKTRLSRISSGRVPTTVMTFTTAAAKSTKSAWAIRSARSLPVTTASAEEYSPWSGREPSSSWSSGSTDWIT